MELANVLKELRARVRENEGLAQNSVAWAVSRLPRGVPRFSYRHREIIVEVAFLRAFLAWEIFLEESFILYTLGKRSPRGKPPRSFVVPPNRTIAEQLCVPERREYVDWAVDLVIERAKRFFLNGRPYAPVLRSQINTFTEMKTIRNTIVHSSSSSQEKFKSLVRRKLGPCPPGLTVGGFLSTTVPGSSPPESFLEDYFQQILLAAERIVP